MLNQTRVSSANDVQVQIVNLLGNSQNSIYDMFFFYFYFCNYNDHDFYCEFKAFKSFIRNNKHSKG